MTIISLHFFMLSSISKRFTSSTVYQNSIDFYLNGKHIILKEGEFDPIQSVADFLRSDKIKLFGTKIGCGEGGCGACTVVLSSYDPITKTVKHRPINSCLTPVGQLHHTSLTTVEALGNLREGVHPLQQSIVKHHATQCGFCTPGFVMNGYAMLLDNPHPTTEQIDEQFDGNLCRCTGYRSISDSLREFAIDSKPIDEDIISNVDTKIKPHHEPFVPEYAKHPITEPICIHNEGITFYIPATMEQFIEIKKQNPQAKIVVGSSELGIEFRQNKPSNAVIISSAHIPEMCSLNIENNKLTFGANTPLQDIMLYCEHKVKSKTLKPEQERLLKQLRERLRFFASTQIRNTAAVIGNIAYGGAATDLSNFLLATDCTYEIINSKTGEKRIDSIDNFYTGYKKTKLSPYEIVTKFEIPLMEKDQHIFCFKQAHRRDDDICIVSATMKATIDSNDTIKDIKIAYSGMAACPSRAKGTEQFLKGKKFTDETIKSAYPYIHKDLPLDDYAPGGFVPFRRDLAESFLFKFYQQTQKERGLKYEPDAIGMIERPVGKYHLVNCQQDDDHLSGKQGKVGDPIHHRSGLQQATGEATYVDDIPDPNGCLHGGYVMSSIPYGTIKKIDYSKALAAPGVVDVVTAKDIRGLNSVGDVWKDEEVFAEKEVRFIGQPIALILADTHDHAWEAAKLVEIEYEEKHPVLSIDQAIKENSFYDSHHSIKRGDPEKAFKKAPHVVEGDLSANGQSHFYLETNTCLVEYLEGDHLKVTGSSQNPTFCQMEIARVNGLKANQVDFHVKRLGGGFGGKETRCSTVSNAASVAAMKLKRPVRLSLDRQVDMATMGLRHPSKTHYKVGFDNDGHILAVDMDMYFDCGWSLDISIAVTDRALFHSDSSYYIPNLYTKSHLCKTNTITSTAFRGFGGPQGMISMETIVERVAHETGIPVEEVRRRNLYQEGQMTHFGIPLTHCNATRCWETIKKQFDFDKQKEEVAKFNQEHKYRKRGVCMTPLKFGIAFTFSSLNQGNCLVHIYKDGSVLISHGGTEMGQGLHTKMCQICAQVLDIPVELVRIDETSTDKCANTSATAASSGSDLNGHAVYNAAIQLKQRLAPFRTDKSKKWPDVCMEAYLAKTDLSAHGYYCMQDVCWNWETGLGKPFQYYVYGAAGSLVEIDLLTGDHQVIRSDVLFDVGESLNKGIDVGQVEGAFMQGYGWLTMEEFMKGNYEENRWIKPGKVHTNGPGFYKVPGFNDIPQQFNVGFLKDSMNSIGVFSSKAIGEPPFLLANSIAFALIDAIRAARKENGLSTYFQYDFPLSAPRIRELCGVKLSQEKK